MPMPKWLLPIFAAPSVFASNVAEASTTLKVLSFNIRYGSANDGANAWQVRKAEVLQVLLKGYDIIGLQEVEPFQQAEVSAALPEYSAVFRSRESNPQVGEGVPIFFRTDRFDLMEAKTLWLSNTPLVPGSRNWGNFLPRIVTVATLKDKINQKELSVFNTHYDYQFSFVQVKSSEFIRKEMASRPSNVAAIVLGDLNADADSEALKVFTQAPTLPLTDTWREANGQAETSTWHDWKGPTAGKRIDFILNSEDHFAVKAADIFQEKINGRYPSDHFPVSAELEWRD